MDPIYASFSLFLIGILAISIYIKRKALSKKNIPEIYYEKAEKLNKELEPTGFAYDIENDIFFSIKDCWQRKFGYCRLYDEAAAPLSMIIDCEPVYFEYNGRKWLIEFWKGQYGINTGAEIGIYVSDDEDLDIPGYFNGTLYKSIEDKEMLPFSFSLKKNGKLLFTRKELHWWLTGFVMGEFSDTDELTMDICIKFPDLSMCKAFLTGLYESGYTSTEVIVRYNSVYFSFTSPKTKQPLSRNKITEELMQKNNSFYCTAYNNITKDYFHTLDKLEYLKSELPVTYKTVTSLGQSEKLYNSYNQLKQFIK